MTLNIRLEFPKEDSAGHDAPALEHEVIVSDELASVSKSHIEIILQKMAQILMAKGFRALAARSLATSYIPYRATAGKIYSPARESSP